MSGNVLVQDRIGVALGEAGHRVTGHHHLVAEVDRLDGQSEHPQVDRDPGGHHGSDPEVAQPGVERGAGERRDAVEPGGHQVTGLGAQPARSSSVAGVPARRWSGLRRTAATSWQFTVEPARSARNSAVQWTTGTPWNAGGSQQPGGVGDHADPASAASASCGKELRSPTTPRWISMVSTAQSLRCGQLAQVDGQPSSASVTVSALGAAQCGSVPAEVRAPPLSVSSGTSATIVGGPPVVGLAARRPHDGLHHV